MIVSAGSSETFDFALPIGIGMVDSAINLTKLILKNSPDILIFIGSAGSYGNYQIFDVVKSNIASNIELSFLQNKSYTPIDNVIKSVNDKNQNNKEKNIINSSNYITTDINLAKNFLKWNIELENMEFYSVVKVASHFKIPVFGLFVVTNFCNENANSNFEKNHKKAMKILTDSLKEIVPI